MTGSTGFVALGGWRPASATLTLARTMCPKNACWHANIALPNCSIWHSCWHSLMMITSRLCGVPWEVVEENLVLSGVIQDGRQNCTCDALGRMILPDTTRPLTLAGSSGRHILNYWRRCEAGMNYRPADTERLPFDVQDLHCGQKRRLRGCKLSCPRFPSLEMLPMKTMRPGCFAGISFPANSGAPVARDLVS